MCISPIVMKNNGSSLLGATIAVPCGRCFQCLSRRQKAWTFRLMEEAKASSSVGFWTFTYEKIWRTPNGLPTLVKKDYQDFMKRLRKNTGVKNIKYYACGEYGTETHRPHYHAIMFNLPLHSNLSSIVADSWGHGHVDHAPGNEATFAYVTKYIMKGNLKKEQRILDEETGELMEDDRQREFSLMSKKLGSAFLKPPMIKHLKENLTGTVKIEGRDRALPRYYREKIFSLEERLLLRHLAAEETKKVLEQKFNDDPVAQNEWIKDQIRKHNKNLILQRNKL